MDKVFAEKVSEKLKPQLPEGFRLSASDNVKLWQLDYEMEKMSFTVSFSLKYIHPPRIRRKEDGFAVLEPHETEIFVLSTEIAFDIVKRFLTEYNRLVEAFEKL